LRGAEFLRVTNAWQVRRSGRKKAQILKKLKALHGKPSQLNQGGGIKQRKASNVGGGGERRRHSVGGGRKLSGRRDIIGGGRWHGACFVGCCG